MIQESVLAAPDQNSGARFRFLNHFRYNHPLNAMQTIFWTEFYTQCD